MPMLYNFDEITTPETSYLTIDEYFGEMSLDRKQKRERIRFAKKLKERLMELIQYMLFILEDEGVQNVDFLERNAVNRYKSVAEEEYLEWLDDIDDYVATVVPLLMLSWRKIAKDKKNRDEKIKKRIENDVAESTNSIFNITDYDEAVRGGKKRKQWKTIIDDRTRKTHIELHNEIKGIDEFFVSSRGSLLLYPRDTFHGADLSEIINCRCSLKYLD